MTTAVFDCVVLLQAAANPRGPAGACLDFVEAGDIKLFLSSDILDEARDVFTRPTVRNKFPRLTEEYVERFLLKLASLATLLHDVPSASDLPRDRKDEAYLDLAIATRASFIVTRDRDLLDLMHDDVFRNAEPWLTIVDPSAFVSHVRAEVARRFGYE
jgi:putative PIN family toxin of toxin-antitoxin system